MSDRVSEKFVVFWSEGELGGAWGEEVSVLDKHTVVSAAIKMKVDIFWIRAVDMSAN